MTNDTRMKNINNCNNNAM